MAMDTDSNPPPVANPPATGTATASALRAYRIPFLLLAISVFFQLVIVPRSYPPSHYDVLGVERGCSIEKVNEAYEKLSSKWSSGVEVVDTIEFIKIRYSFELLTNPIWKRDYDIYGIDEQVNVIEKVHKQYAGASLSKIDFPLLEAAFFDPVDNAIDAITPDNFLSKIEDSKALLIQVFSTGSSRCAQFSDSWKRIAAMLDGVANTGMVELGTFELAVPLAERKPTGRPFFRYGLPSFVAFPPGCNKSNCLVRYMGEPSVQDVTEWCATSVLGLPRIPYYSKESLIKSFLEKSSHYKVKVIFFSKTGERATPIVRQVAKSYWSYASFAFVRWQEEESSFWWNVFGVESAPAVVFLNEPGVKPIVYHGPGNNSWLLNIMEQNKHQVLPQLRSVSSVELGCDAQGFSRAGNDTRIWYCVVLVGRLSPELNEMREAMRNVQQMLSNDGELNAVDRDPASSPAATALKEKRLTFTWLDGEAQHRYCFFHIHSETIQETCGPRTGLTEVPKLFIVRYNRNSTEESANSEKTTKNVWFQLDEIVGNPASQLVAKYNGSSDKTQIIHWIADIIRDGDSRQIPYMRMKTPRLDPEDADPVWSRGAEGILSTSRGMKQKIGSMTNRMNDYLNDPRIGPSLLLAALMSFAAVWLQRNQLRSKSSSEQSTKEETRLDQRRRRRTESTQDQPPSITDEEPKDADQMPLSDSDTE